MKTSQFTFNYDSNGVGCATVKLAVGEQCVKFDATYLGPNPLGDILQSLAGMVEGLDNDCVLTWCSEPGTLNLRILVKGELAHLLVEDSGWGIKIDADVPFREFVEGVVKEAERNLQLHGIAGFSEDWATHYDVFPLSAFFKLKGVSLHYNNDGGCNSSIEEKRS